MHPVLYTDRVSWSRILMLCPGIERLSWSSTEAYCSYFKFHFNRHTLAFYIHMHIHVITLIKQQSLQKTVKIGALSFVCDIIMMQYWIAVLEKSLHERFIQDQDTVLVYSTGCMWTLQLKHCMGEIFPVSVYSIGIQDWYTIQDACERYLKVYSRTSIIQLRINQLSRLSKLVSCLKKIVKTKQDFSKHTSFIGTN